MMTKEEFLDDYLEKQGYEDWDLLLTVMDNVVKDLGDYWSKGRNTIDLLGDSEFLLPLYRLFGELVISDRNLLMSYLPKEHSPYQDQYVGGLRQ